MADTQIANTALEALTKTSPYVRAPDALQSRLADIQTKRSAAQQERQKTGQELVSQARAYQEAAGAPIPGLAEVREKQAALDIGEAPKMQPLDIKGDDLVVWGLIAALGGMATRQPALSAMNALTSAISGYQAGNKEQFERELQKYKVHADYVSKQQDKFEREAKRLMEDRTLSLEARKAGMDLLQKTYTSQKDPIDDYDKQAELIYKEIDKMRDQQFKLDLLNTKLSGQAEKFTGVVPRLDESGRVMRDDSGQILYERTTETPSEKLAREQLKERERATSKEKEFARKKEWESEKIRLQADARILAKTEAEKQKALQGYEPARQRMEESVAGFKKVAAAARELADHPSMGRLFGGLTSRTPTVIASTGDAEALLNQVKDSSVINLVKSLKSLSPQGATGFGSLTEKEGARLEVDQTGLGKVMSEDFARQKLLEIAENADGAADRIREGFDATFNPLLSGEPISGPGGPSVSNW